MAVLLACTLGGLGLIAGAQPSAGGVTPTTVCDPNDPYGCLETTTTSLAPGAVPTCTVSVSAAVAGAEVTALITNVPLNTQIDLRFNGVVVDSVVSSADATAAAEPGFADVVLSFRVPDLAPGSYSLQAVGPGFLCECLPGQGFQVLAANQNNNGNNGGGNGGGNLARTGTTIAGLLLVAVALLVIGRELKRRADRQTAV